MASGVAAVVRHLPAGSPATLFCIHSVVEKANSLCSKAMTQDAEMWNNWQGESEPCKKVFELLLCLLSVVDQYTDITQSNEAFSTIHSPTTKRWPKLGTGRNLFPGCRV